MMKYTTEQLETAIILFNSNLRFELKDTVEFGKTFNMEDPCEDEIVGGMETPHLWYFHPYSDGNSVFYKSEELFFIRPEMVNGELVLRMTKEEISRAKEFTQEFLEKELPENKLDICHLADVFFFGGLLSSIEEETVSSLFESLQEYGDNAVFLYHLRVAPFGDTIYKYVEEEGYYYVTLRHKRRYETDGVDYQSNWEAIRYLNLVSATWFLKPWRRSETMTERLLEIYKMIKDMTDADYNHLRYIVSEIKDWCKRSGHKFPDRFDIDNK